MYSNTNWPFEAAAEELGNPTLKSIHSSLKPWKTLSSWFSRARPTLLTVSLMPLTVVPPPELFAFPSASSWFAIFMSDHMFVLIQSGRGCWQCVKLFLDSLSHETAGTEICRTRVRRLKPWYCSTHSHIFRARPCAAADKAIDLLIGKF